MLLIWRLFYTEVYGEVKPGYPWTEIALHFLFVLNLFALALFLWRYRKNLLCLLLAILLSTVELLVSHFIWTLGSLSVSGVFF